MANTVAEPSPIRGCLSYGIGMLRWSRRRLAPKQTHRDKDAAGLKEWEGGKIKIMWTIARSGKPHPPSLTEGNVHSV